MVTVSANPGALVFTGFLSLDLPSSPIVDVGLTVNEMIRVVAVLAVAEMPEFWSADYVNDWERECGPLCLDRALEVNERIICKLVDGMVEGSLASV